MSGSRKTRPGAYIRTEPIWNRKCMRVMVGRNRKVFLLGEKAARNFCETSLITQKAEELESFAPPGESHSAGLRLEPMRSNEDVSLPL